MPGRIPRSFIDDLLVRADIVDLIKSMDKRAERLTAEQIDLVIDMGYGELATIQHLFTNEEIIDMQPWYDELETKITINIEEDVVAIYDTYLTVENLSFDEFEHGIKKIKKPDAIYKDNRYNGVVHINLDQAGEHVDNAVIKYFYTPQSTDDEIYMDQQTYLACVNAWSAALYDRLHDIERSMQKLSAMRRTTMAVVPLDPEDLIDPKESIFPDGV